MGAFNDNQYELRIARRDGQKIPRRNLPYPVHETFDIDDRKQVEDIVGKHFVRMAAAAEDKEIHSRMRIEQMDGWLPDYQCEIWRTWGNPDEPEMISFSTEGWN